MLDSEKKKRKVSKKTKRSWRKHVDTKDVDAFLENERLEERLGVPFSERNDSDLFIVDTKPKEDCENVKSERPSRLTLESAQPRFMEILIPQSAVQDPISKRNRVRSVEERKNPITRRLEATRKLSGNLKLKEKVAAKNKLLAVAKRACRPKRGEFDTDLWNESKDVLDKVNSQWFTSDTVRHTLSAKGIKKKKIPISVHRKPTNLPAISEPHPGISYNPSYEDHQDLLRVVVEKEIKLMKEEAHLNRVTSKMFQKVTAEQKDNNWLKESSEGLPLTGNLDKSKKKSKDENESDEDPTVKSVNPPVKNAKKTLVQRRKQKEQKKLALSLKQAKVEKKKVSDIYKLRALEKHLKAKEEKIKLLQEKRNKVKERKATEPKQLNQLKFEPPEVEFKLGEELSGNLRNADPTGNLLKDRFKSLQQRSIIAPTTRTLKLNKAKVKRFVKPDHKIDDTRFKKN